MLPSWWRSSSSVPRETGPKWSTKGWPRTVTHWALWLLLGVRAWLLSVRYKHLRGQKLRSKGPWSTPSFTHRGIQKWPDIWPLHPFLWRRSRYGDRQRTALGWRPHNAIHRWSTLETYIIVFTYVIPINLFLNVTGNKRFNGHQHI